MHLRCSYAEIISQNIEHQSQNVQSRNHHAITWWGYSPGLSLNSTGYPLYLILLKVRYFTGNIPRLLVLFNCILGPHLVQLQVRKPARPPELRVELPVLRRLLLSLHGNNNPKLAKKSEQKRRKVAGNHLCRSTNMVSVTIPVVVCIEMRYRNSRNKIIVKILKLL